VGSSSLVAPPAPARKKLPPRRAKRKNPTMVSDEEDDENTEDGLICKRNRATVVELPAIESTGPDYAENPPSVSTPFESTGTLCHRILQLLEAFWSRLWIFSGLPSL